MRIHEICIVFFVLLAVQVKRKFHKRRIQHFNKSNFILDFTVAASQEHFQLCGAGTSGKEDLSAGVQSAASSQSHKPAGVSLKRLSIRKKLINFLRKSTKGLPRWLKHPMTTLQWQLVNHPFRALFGIVGALVAGSVVVCAIISHGFAG